MFGFPIPYALAIKLGLAAIVALIIGMHFAGDAHVKSDLKKSQSDLVELNIKYEALQKNFVKVTKDSETYAAQAIHADAIRIKITDDLNSSITKLRTQKVPTDCKEAIEWSIKNKGDLKW